MSLEYIREYYKVPAEKGRKVVIDGKSGIVVGSHGPHIEVNLDKNKPNNTGFYHPTDGVEYGELGRIRKMTRSQKRYWDYLRSEYNGTFAEYLGI